MSLARKEFWENYQLRFTQPSAFNDPFDCLPSYSFLPEHLMPGHAGFGELASLFYGLEKDTAKFNDDTAIFCMSEVWICPQYQAPLMVYNNEAKRALILKLVYLQDKSAKTFTSIN